MQETAAILYQAITPRITLEALNKAVAFMPGASLSSLRLACVTMAAMVPPPSMSITTSALTAPGVTALTVPDNWFLAESFAFSNSVPIMMDEALISANAAIWVRRPSDSVLSRVTTATMRAHSPGSPDSRRFAAGLAQQDPGRN